MYLGTWLKKPQSFCGFMVSAGLSIWLLTICSAKTHYQKNKKNPRKGIARPQSQFPHSCVCERFMYSHDRSAYSTTGKYVDRSWEYINRSQTHECGNWDWGLAVPEKEYIGVNGIFLAVWCMYKQINPRLKESSHVCKIAELWMRSSRLVRASGCQCQSQNSPGLKNVPGSDRQICICIWSFFNIGFRWFFPITFFWRSFSTTTLSQHQILRFL